MLSSMQIVLIVIFSQIIVHGCLPYNTVVTFGDSYSDTKNGYALTNSTWPPIKSPNNSNSAKYIDDQLWNEIFTHNYLTNSTLQDYSCGCATTDNSLVRGTMHCSPISNSKDTYLSSINATSVREQISKYIASNSIKTLDFDRTLYIIWAGINNYASNKTSTVSDTIESLDSCLKELVFIGAKNFVIFNQPTAKLFPYYQDGTGRENASVISSTQEHNTNLSLKYNSAYSSVHTQLNIKLLLFDVASFVSKVINNSAYYNFDNHTNTSYWTVYENGTASHSNSSLNLTNTIFYDPFHFTSAMHKLIAQELYTFLGGTTTSTSTSRATMTHFYSYYFLVFALFFVFNK